MPAYKKTLTMWQVLIQIRVPGFGPVQVLADLPHAAGSRARSGGGAISQQAQWRFRSALLALEH